MPARLSSPNEPTRSMTYWMSSSVDLAVEQHLLAAAAEARLRTPAQVHHDLDEVALGRQPHQAVADLLRQRIEQEVQVVGDLTGLAGHGSSCPGGVGGRWRGHRVATGTMAGSATRTRVSFNSRETVAIVSKPASSSRRSSGDS